jgi:aspartate/methionine/tyrosine aminotransferase
MVGTFIGRSKGMTTRISDRVASLGTTVFGEMSRMAGELGAINLGQGFPEFSGPDVVKEAAKQAIDNNQNQYAPPQGTPELRGSIAKTYRTAYKLDADPDDEVTVTTGATEALLAAMLGLLNPGDEVIVFEPFYDAYPAQISFAGGKTVPVRLHTPDWSFDPDELTRSFNERTRAILITNPHNPTGKVFTAEELDLISELCHQHDAVAVTDEVYDRLIYDGAVHIPIATRPGMRDRTITINSTGKTFSMTGWKIGYAIASPDLTTAVRGAHQFITFATSTPFQAGMAAGMRAALESDYYDQLQARYTRLRDRMQSGLEGAGLTVLPASGSFFLLVDASDRGFEDDVSFCMYLLKEIGVAAIPPSAFYADPKTAPILARFCFAKEPETLNEAAKRLAKLAFGHLGEGQ